MNHKLFLPLILSTLAGCTATRPVPVSVVTGTGGGTAGIQQAIASPLNTPINTANSTLSNNPKPTFTTTNAVAINTTNSANSPLVSDKTVVYSSTNTASIASAVPQSTLDNSKPVVGGINSGINISNQIKPGSLFNPKQLSIIPSLDSSTKKMASDEPEQEVTTAAVPNSANLSSESKFKKNKFDKVESGAPGDLANAISKRYSNDSNKAVPSSHPTSAGNPSSYKISGENYKVLPFSNGFVEKGVASWYGPDFHGEKTSNGETYDMYGMTAAHKRLPIPSYVKVTNLKNKRSVVLRINDRGPFYSDRVIDLSYAAAQKLDVHQPGTEMVQIEAITTPTKESVYLQLGVFANPLNAQLLQKKVVENKMPEPVVREVMVAGKVAYRVQLGPLFSTDKVNEFNAKLAKMGIAETWYVTDNKIN